MSNLDTVAGDGETVSDTSAAGRTVITAVPEISDEGSVAVMVATPVATAVTRPVDDTDAVDEFEDDHVTELVRSWVLKSEYTPVAVSCCVASAGTLATGGDTVIATSTAGSTVMTAVPEINEDGSVAVMVATPVATPVTRPVEDTDAVESLDDDHVTELVKFAVDPSEYNPVAVSCWVSPTGTLAVSGETVTATKTAGRTVITAVPEIKDEGSVAVIVATPVATPVTRPVEDTVAVAVMDDDHVTELVKLAVEPSEYKPVAVSC
jgi:predicted phosphoribosyltransferase